MVEKWVIEPTTDRRAIAAGFRYGVFNVKSLGSDSTHSCFAATRSREAAALVLDSLIKSGHVKAEDVST